MINQRRKSVRVFIFSTILLILSVLILLAVLKFGIPLIINLSSFFLNSNSSKQTSLTLDYIPEPILYSVFEATNTAQINIKGKSMIDGVVKIVLDGEQVTKLETLKNSEFSAPISLKEGDNSIYAITQNPQGKDSLPSEVLSLTLDTIPPSLEITTPANESHYSGNDQKKIQISGKTESDVSLFINNHQVIINHDGEFNFSYSPLEGENKLIFIAQDSAENKTEKELDLFYSP